MDVSNATPDHGAGPTREHAPQSTEPRPDTIGDYRILDTLGEGGMGIVYLAEQTAPVRRRVALKLIKLGMDTTQVIARFEAERQALAMMNHPNIARVFDAGSTAQGRPYFVMEYVPGIPITEYCDLKCLSLEQRLGLFTQVCNAIQHAHQRGIIHRDIKPSNVLVGSEDGSPQLKVIDFGIAKATSQRLTERTLFTQHGLMIGTPEYMSPEQAGTSALDVDTRTDIYSLGVLLYELLVGALPFDPQVLRRAAAVEMLRIIREEDPPRPTVRFSSLGATASQVARQRMTDVRSLARQLKGELEWITMRALEKDPDRRYASASELAADLRRHLDNEAVAASPPSRAYRIGKFIRRNRGPVAATLAVVVTLLAASTVSTVMYVRSEAARVTAENQALRNRLDSAALRAALLGDTEEYRKRSQESLEVHRSMLDADDPEYAIYLVNRLVVIAETSPWDDAVDQDKIAALLADLTQECLQALRRALPSGDPDLVEALELIAGHDGLKEEDREWALREALALARRVTPDDPGLADKMIRLADLVASRSTAQRSAGNASDADRLEDEALGLLREAIQRSEPPGETLREKLADLLERRGGRLLADGAATDAAPVLREALTLFESLPTPEPRHLVILKSRLGRSLAALGRFDEAESLLLQSDRALQGEFEGKTASGQAVINTLAELYDDWGKPLEAQRYRARILRPTVLALRELPPLEAPHIRGRRGGFSASLAGRSVWAYAYTNGETAGKDLGTPSSNTWSWTDDFDASDGIGRLRNGTGVEGLPTNFLPYTEAEAAYNRAKHAESCTEDCGSAYALQPGSLALDPARGALLVFYEKVRASNYPFDLTREGSSIALWTDPLRPALRPGAREAAPMLFSAEEPAWGSGAVVADDDLYAYACRCVEASCPCLVARAPLAAALERSAWRFYAGNGKWGTDWRTARPVMDGAARLTVHWNAHLGRYLAIHAVPQGKAIALRTAERPEGPWSEVLLYVVGVPSPPGMFEWDAWLDSALGHPELARENGRIEYVTYHRGTGWFAQGETRLVEITFR